MELQALALSKGIIITITLDLCVTDVPLIETVYRSIKICIDQ